MKRLAPALLALGACHPAQPVRPPRPPASSPPLGVAMEPGWPVSNGSLTRAQLVGVFHRQGSALADCYKHQQSGVIRLVTVKLLIGPTGAVLDDRIEESGLTSEQGECVLAAVKRWEFPAPDGGGHFIVSCHLRFRHDDPPDGGASAEPVP
jgi:hypothetical protein